jgi:hypothetical protein
VYVVQPEFIYVGFNKKHQLLKSKKSLFDETNSSDKCIKDNVNPREFKPYTILRFQVLKTGPSTVKENVLSMYLVKEKRGTLQPKMSMGPLLVGEFLSDGYGRIPPPLGGYGENIICIRSAGSYGIVYS